MDLLKDQLDNEVGVAEAFPISKPGRIGNFGSVLVKLACAEDKKEVVRAEHELKDSAIYVTHDRTARERELQRKMAKIEKEEEDKVEIIPSTGDGNSQDSYEQRKGEVLGEVSGATSGDPSAAVSTAGVDANNQNMRSPERIRHNDEFLDSSLLPIQNNNNATWGSDDLSQCQTTEDVSVREGRTAFVSEDDIGEDDVSALQPIDLHCNVDVLFWNVSGLKNFLELSVSEFEDDFASSAIIGLTETWSSDEKLKLTGLFSDFECIADPATKVEAEGRARGGICVLYKRDHVSRLLILEKNDIWIAIKCCIRNVEIIIVTVHLRDCYGDRIELLVNFVREMTGQFSGPMIIGGDFNARTGLHNQLEEDSIPIYSNMDKVLDENGVAVLESLKELGFRVLNGRSSDIEANDTFLGKSNSTVDHARIHIRYAEHVRDFVVVKAGDSDHLPVIMWLEKGGNQRVEKLRNPAIPVPHKLKWDGNKLAEFVEEITKIPTTEEDDINVLNNNLIETIRFTASKLGMTAKTGGKLGRTSKIGPISSEEWEKFYGTLLPAREIVSLIQVVEMHPDFDRPIDSEELINAVKWVKPNKAPGPDGIQSNFYKALPPCWLKSVEKLFNKVLSTGEIPSSWGQSEVIMFYKKGDKKDPLNYRGIALSNVVTKIFATVITKRLNKWIERYKILPEAQAGFRFNRSSQDNLFTLHAKIASTLNKHNGKLFLAFIHFKRAFDSVAHNVLWRKLRTVGVSSQIVRVLQNLYKSARFRVRTDQHNKTREIETTQGILQGDPSSPILFTLFLADIVDFFINRGHRGVHENMEILLFADDLTIMSEDLTDLQAKLNILEEYCRQNKLEVNTQKTKILICQKSGRSRMTRAIYYNKRPLEIVRSYVYLGVPISRSGLFGTAADHFISKSKIALRTVWSPMLCWDARMRLFQEVVQSTLLYGAGIWGLNYVEQLEKVQQRFYTLLLGVSFSTPRYMIRLETGCSPLELLVVKRALKYLVRVLNMPQHRFPRVSLDVLMAQDMSDRNVAKLNWFTCLKLKLAEFRLERVLVGLQPESLRLSIPIIMESMRNSRFRRDAVRAMLSSFSTMYKDIKQLNVLRCEEYLMLDAPLAQIRVVAQCRLAGKKAYMFKIHNFLYEFDCKLRCQCCNLEENESLEHVMIRCPLYVSHRENYLENFELPVNLQIFEKADVEKIFCYVFSCCEDRRFELS